MKFIQSILLISLVFFNLTSNAEVRYVTVSGAGTLNGSSWSNAAPGTALQSTITLSTIGDEVWVACGTYKTTTSTNRNTSFSMKNGVSVYGSFLGSETILSQRSFTCGPCSILSGEIGAVGNTDNSYKVISNSNLDNTAIIDGFVISDANDNRTPNSTGNGLGGGMYNHGYSGSGFCHPVVRNCIFTNNSASWGAGAFNNGYSGGTSEPKYTNCIFYKNHATIEAGGMDSYGVAGNASPTLINCLFYENTSATNVGAMYCWGGNQGGKSNPILINCAFVNNKALNGYGGAFIADNIDENQSSSSGSCTVTLQNCVVWNNTATGLGQQFYLKGSGSQVVATYSDIDLSGQASPHILSGATTGNLNTDPKFVNLNNAIGLDNCWLTADDGLHLQSESTLLNAGSSTNALTTDIMGVGRYSNPEIGVYETVPPVVVKQILMDNLSVFPNPSQGIYNFNFNDNLTHTLRVYSIFGTLVLTTNIKNSQQLNLSSFSNGIYIVNWDEGKTLKLIKE